MAQYGFMSSRFDRRSFLGTGAALFASLLVGVDARRLWIERFRRIAAELRRQPPCRLPTWKPPPRRRARSASTSWIKACLYNLVAGFSKKYSWAKVESVVGSQTDLRNRAITESVAHAETADVLTLSNAHRKALLDSDIVRAVDIHEKKPTTPPACSTRITMHTPCTSTSCSTCSTRT